MRVLQIPVEEETLRRLDALAERDGRSRPGEVRWLLQLAIEWAEANPPRLVLGVVMGGGGGEGVGA